MTFNEAAEIAAYSKEIFPRTTDAQMAVVRDLIYPFPDAKFVRELIKRLATETTILPTPMIRQTLADELRRRGQTAEAYAKAQERAADSQAVRTREEIDRFIEGFSDDDLEALKPDALQRLSGTLNAYAMEFVKKRHPRRSYLLKQAIYEMVNPAQA